ARTEDNYKKSELTAEERKFFSGVSNVKYVMMLAENWCGDVHRNSPLIAHVVDAVPGAELRVFFRDKETDLRDTLLNNGYQSIPVVVFFDKDWNEIGRWYERAHAATTKAAQIRSKTLDGVPKEQQDAAMAEFRKQVQAAYDEPGGPLWRAAALLKDVGRRALVVPTDVTRRPSLTALVERTRAELGRIDILVNNAGIYRAAATLDVTEEHWDAIMSINARAVFFASQAVLPT